MKKLMAGMVMAAVCLAAPLAWGADEESFVLANGLKVVLVRQAATPVATMQIIIRSGAVDEQGRGQYGLAHLMEHMAFKGGTRHPDPGEISALIEKNGGDTNAYTSSDATVYHLTLPGEEARLGLDLLADMVFSPAYDPKEYELEKEVVVQEIKRGQDNPDRELMEAFFAAAYPDHPYGRPVIGYEDTVRGATLQAAKAFHRAHYRPDNAVLVVTGGFDRAEVLKAIDEFYKPLVKPEEPLEKTPRPALPPAAAPTVVVLESPGVELAKIFMGFRGPSGADPEAPVHDLLSSVLTGGKSSRLTEEVKDKQGLVTDVSASSYTPRYQGSFMIALETEPAKVLAAIKATWAELEKLAQPPAEAELGRSRALAEKAFLAEAESTLGLASQITDFELMLGDWRLRDGYLPLWNRTSPAEVAAAARQAFTPANLALVVMLPANGDKKNYPTQAQLTELAGQLHLPASAETATDGISQFTEVKLATGPRLVISRDASLPQVTVKAAVMGGLLAEKPGQGGLCNLLAESWGKATQERPAAELARAVEALGAAISGGSGRNSLFLTGSFLSANLDEGLRLFTEVLTRPAFHKEDVEQVRAEALAEIKAQGEDLAGRAFRLLAKALYPAGHPYSRDQLGTAESVAKLGPADVAAMYQALVRPENLVITVAGDIEPRRVQEFFESALAGWRPEGEASPVALPPAPAPAPQELKEALARAQTHVALGFLAPGLGSPDAPALEVLAGYLGGMSGPLFRELRDKQGLAYAVHCGYTQGLNSGSFSFYIATNPAQAQAALQGFRDIIENVRQKPISEADLAGARRYLIGTTKIRLQTVAARATQAMLNSLYGLGLDHDEKRLEAIGQVTAQEVQAVAQKYLQNEALAVIGSEK